MHTTIPSRRRSLAIAAALVAVSAFPAAAQTYPAKPVTFVVPFAAGGANDIVARLIQPGLEKADRKSVV